MGPVSRGYSGFPHLIAVPSLILALVLVVSPCFGQGWVLTGSVTDAAGNGLGGVDIDLLDPATGLAHSLLSDLTLADGTFSTTILSPIVAGTYNLRLQPPPGFFEATTSIPLTGNTDTGVHPLAAGWVLSGFVLDVFDNPAPNIDIDMRPQGAGGGAALELSGDVTGLDGSFALTMPAITGNYEIGFIPLPGVHLVETVVENVFIFGNSTLPTVHLAIGHFISGQVVNSDGVAVSGLDINAYDIVTGLSAPLTLDDTDLTGAFDVLIPDAIFDIVIRQVTPIPGVEYAPVLIPNVDIYQNVVLGQITIHDGFHVTGQVVNSLGQPLRNANFDAEDAAGNRLWLTNDGTSVTGGFDLLLPEGLISLEVDPPVLGPLLVTQQLEVAVGPSLDIGQITLPDGVSITGHLIDPLGFSVPSVNVELRDLSTNLIIPAAHENGNAEGLFNAVVEPGDYDLLFDPPLASGVGSMTLPGVSAPQSVALGDIPLPAGHHFSGIILDGSSTATGAELVLTDIATSTVLPRIGNRSGVVGEFSIQVPTGVYQLEVIPPPSSVASSWVESEISFSQDINLIIDLAGPPLPVTDVSCQNQGTVSSLSWTNPHPDFSQIDVLRDGNLLATLPGNSTTFTENLVPSTTVIYQIVAIRLGVSSPAAECSFVPNGSFLRGDLNGDGVHQIDDVISILGYLFGGQVLTCTDAADVNDNGAVNLGDPVSLLNYIFGSGVPPAAPFPTEGVDPTPDQIPCV